MSNIWGHLKKILLSYRRQLKASGEAKNDQDCVALAKTLWKWRWSLLKKPSNVSVEEKHAIAEMERADEGFVHCFRSIIQRLVNLFDHSHSNAQAKRRLQQLRTDIRAVDDAHLEQILTFFADHWEHALRYLWKKGMGKHRRGSNSSKVTCHRWSITLRA
jgi:Transposase